MPNFCLAGVEPRTLASSGRRCYHVMMLNVDDWRTWPPLFMESSNGVSLEEQTPRTFQTNYRPRIQKSETGKT